MDLDDRYRIPLGPTFGPVDMNPIHLRSTRTRVEPDQPDHPELQVKQQIRVQLVRLDLPLVIYLHQLYSDNISTGMVPLGFWVVLILHWGISPISCSIYDIFVFSIYDTKQTTKICFAIFQKRTNGASPFCRSSNAKGTE